MLLKMSMNLNQRTLTHEKNNDKGKDGPTAACRNVNWKFGKKAAFFFEQNDFRKPLGQDDVFARSHKNLLRFFFQIDLDLQYLSCWLPFIIIFSHTQKSVSTKIGGWSGRVAGSGQL